MKKSLLRFACLAAILLPAGSAFAADLEPPPPVDDLRPSTFDFNVGVFGVSNALKGHYDFCACDPEMSGTGYGVGLKAGMDYRMDSGFLLGLAGDYTFGGSLAENRDPAQATWLDMNGLATARARAGYSNGGATIYVTGGLAAANMEFGGLVGPAGVESTDAQWTYGWTIGGGIEYALTDAISVDLEYLYIKLSDTAHTLSDGMGNGGTLDMTYDDMHTVRAGMTYHFSL